MRYFVYMLMPVLLFVGCAAKKSDIDKALEKEEKIVIATTYVHDPFLEYRDQKKIFKRFPFISLKPIDVRGKFSDEFYNKLTLVYTAKDIEEVNFWELERTPKSVDFIYIKPLWVKKYRKVSGDLLENIAYSYNISKEEQRILKDWIRQGGKLWVEFGTYSTKYDVFNKYGEIATYRIAKEVRKSFENVRFLSRPIRTYIFKSKNLDIINYVPTEIPFEIDTSRSVFKDIKRLKLDLDTYIANYFVVLGRGLIYDTKGRPLVTELDYGEGKIVTLLPFEYNDVYYDGELLRWKLLFYLYDER